MLNVSLKMAEEGRNMWEVYHTLFIIASNYNAVVDIYIHIYGDVSYCTQLDNCKISGSLNAHEAHRERRKSFFERKET